MGDDVPRGGARRAAGCLWWSCGGKAGLPVRVIPDDYAGTWGLCAVTDAETEASSVTPWFTSVTDQINPVDLKVDVAHTARMYDYYLGGKDNFLADRQAAEQALAVFPHGRVTARQNRAFLHRVTRSLARDAGIRQFLDVGTGIPTSPNLHEVAQSVAPDCRVVYADNDPIVSA